PANTNKRSLPDFDVRDLATAGGPGNQQVQTDTLVERRKASLASFMASPEQSRLGTRIVPNQYGLPKLYLREGRSLSAPAAGKPSEVAKTFLQNQPEVFSLSASEIDRLRLVVDDVTDNAKFLAFNQTLDGIDVFNAQIKFT